MTDDRAAACLEYGTHEARLLLVRDGETHELGIRPQAHRLVRYMAERNAAIGGSPALCSYDELMEAVWGDEPMHTREELAKLVWELRKKLEPFEAEHLLENERGLGYRLRTCPPTHGSDDASRTLTRQRALWAGVGLLAIAIAVALAAIVTTRDSESGASSEARLRPFVDRIENVLAQSAEGRQEIVAALTGGLRCSIPSPVAGRRIESVADNRQSILQQLASMAAPTEEADEVLTLLQQALQRSIEADRHYRDGFAEAGTRCAKSTDPSFRLAGRLDAQATVAKRRFVAAFDPLAARLHRRTWAAEEI